MTVQVSCFAFHAFLNDKLTLYLAACLAQIICDRILKLVGWRQHNGEE
jgi:hypothetical protein